MSPISLDNTALEALVNEHNVILNPFPNDVFVARLKALQKHRRMAAADPMSQNEIIIQQSKRWHEVSEVLNINASARLLNFIRLTLLNE